MNFPVFKIFTINQEDLESLLISSVRYAIGRRTYITGVTCDIVTKYLNQLSVNALKVIHRDIENPLDGKDYGDQCDYDYWMKLKYDIEEQLRELKED